MSLKKLCAASDVVSSKVIGKRWNQFLNAAIELVPPAFIVTDIDDNI